MATIDEIKQQAAAVKNATQVGENTALRVGGVLVDLCEWMKNFSDNAGSGGGGTSGGSGASLGTLLTKLNSDNPFPTASGQVLTYDGSNFVWKTSTGSGGSTTGGIRIKRNGSTLKDSNGDVLSCTSINFKYGENWNSTPILINSDNEISVDLSVVANNGNGSSSSSNYPLTIYNGSSNTDYITYDGSSSAYLKFKSGFSISKVGLGYEISVSGGGSGSSGTTAGKLRFYKNTDKDTEAYWNGESDFRIIFGSGLNVSWDSTTQITLSATGGSSTGGSVDLSSYLTKTEASTTYAAKSHNHLAADITNFASTVKGIKVDNAERAVSANKLASSVYLWGNSFSGISNIGSSTSNKADLRYVNNIYTGDTFGLYNTVNGTDTSLLSIDNTPNISIAYGYRTNENAILSLFGNKTKIYTNGQNYHFDFVKNVFDVNSNQIHFGSETNGGRISWDATNNAFKIEGNVYATGGITALGVSNNATTSNNVDFTFNKVSARGGTFENLAAGGMTFQNGVISYFQHTLSLKSGITLYSGNSNYSLSLGNTFTLRILSDLIKGFSSQGGGALSLNNVEKLIFGVTGQHYSRYKFDINKAISAGILVSTTETFSDEEADDTAVVAS